MLHTVLRFTLTLVACPHLPVKRDFLLQFAIEGRDEPVTVYTTRPDTLYGATFFVVAADSALAAELAAGTPSEAEFTEYLERIKADSDIDRLATDRPTTGVFLNRYAINPVNGAHLPIYAADYVLADYGTGAIMAVPAHDQRDYEFAKVFDLPIVTVVQPPADWEGEAYPGDGPAVNSEFLDGLGKAQAISAIRMPRRVRAAVRGSTDRGRRKSIRHGVVRSAVAGDVVVRGRCRGCLWVLRRERFRQTVSSAHGAHPTGVPQKPADIVPLTIAGLRPCSQCQAASRLTTP